MRGCGVEESGRKKSLKKNKEEERKGKKMKVIWSLKMTEGSIYTIKKC